jgi:hypothetical protein
MKLVSCASRNPRPADTLLIPAISIINVVVIVGIIVGVGVVPVSLLPA